MSTYISNSNDSINININNVNINEDEKEREPFGILSFSIDIMSIILTQFLTIYDIGNLDTAYCNRKKRDQLLHILSNNESMQYNHLTFNNSNKSIDKLLIWIGNRKIKVLEVSKEEEILISQFLTNNGLLGLSRHCIHLQSLDISHCYDITDTGMIEIGRNCIHLQSLKICFCNNITDTSMIEIGRNCIHLQSLDISERSNITNTTRQLFPYIKVNKY